MGVASLAGSVSLATQMLSISYVAEAAYPMYPPLACGFCILLNVYLGGAISIFSLSLTPQQTRNYNFESVYPEEMRTEIESIANVAMRTEILIALCGIAFALSFALWDDPQRFATGKRRHR